MSSQSWLYWKLLLIAGLFSLAWVFPLFDFQKTPDLLTPQDWSLQETLGSTKADEDFQKAEQPIAFQFPQDHGGHRQFRNEWWYWVGHLQTKEGREFGYQWTIFRTSLFPVSTKPKQAWQSQSIYMGHFAISDLQNQKFYSFERFSRESLGLAGVQVQPFQLWLEDWKLVESVHHASQWELTVQTNRV